MRSKTSKTAVLPGFYKIECCGMVAAGIVVWQSCLPKLYHFGSLEFTTNNCVLHNRISISRIFWNSTIVKSIWIKNPLFISLFFAVCVYSANKKVDILHSTQGLIETLGSMVIFDENRAVSYINKYKFLYPISSTF